MPQSAAVSSNQSTASEERILKNTSYLTIAFIIQKVLSFLYFIFIARQLGPVDLGLYDPIKSLIPILLILIDFSLSTVMVREIARSPDRVEKYLSSILGIKAVLAFVIITSMGLFTNFSGYSSMVKIVLYLDAIIVVLDTFTLTFFAVFRGLQNMKWESIGMIGTQLLTIIFGSISLLLGWGLQSLFIAVVIGSVFNFIFSFYMIRSRLNIRIRLHWDKEIIVKFLKMAFPFAIAAIFIKFYTFTDRFMLLFIHGQGHAGWYATAHKLTYALEFIPSAFAASIYPAMSSYFLHSHADLSKTFQKAMHYLMIIAVPISVGMVLVADKLVIALYGVDYETSILPLRILISSLIVIFLNFPVGAFLNACNRQVINTRNMGITVAINIILNILLIPKYSFNGAALSAFISGFILFFLGLRWVGKIVAYDKRFLITVLGKSTLSALVMAGVIVVLQNYISVFITIPIAAVTYIGILLLVKGVDRSEIATFSRALLNRFK
ncbi:MAG: flippase [Candidatus Kerfeldbacteria bacterium]|nr:flippase [Candidatus Kerfeldbacteria bacterium]